MLHKLFYETADDIYYYLRKFKNPLIICAHADQADCLYFTFQKLFNKQIEVITLSQFLQRSIRETNLEVKIARKSEILLRLSFFWNFESNSFHFFLKCYEMFSELRSYTLNKDLFSSLIEDHDPLINQQLLHMWNIFEDQEIYDEFQAIETIKLSLEEKANTFLNEYDALCFWGAIHYSSLQLDLFHALSSLHHVIFPIHEIMKSSSFPFSWVSWQTGKTLDCPKNTYKNPSKKHSFHFFTDSSFAAILGKIKNERPSHLIDFDTNDNWSHYSSLNSPGIKISCNPFELALIDLYQFFQENISKTYEDFLLKLSDKTKEAIYDKNHFRLKILQLWHKYIQDVQSFKYSGTIEEKAYISILQLFRYITQLDLPRLNIKKISETHSSKFYNLNTFHLLSSIILNQEGYTNILIAQSSSLFSFKREQIPRPLLERLTSIGPIKDDQFSKVFFLNILKDFNLYLIGDTYISQGLYHSSLDLQDLFPLISENTYSKNFSNKTDHFTLPIPGENYFQKSISVSKLQSYLDCPRKYFINYISLPYEISKSCHNLDNRQKGELEHLILEKYFTLNRQEIANSLDREQYFDFSKNYFSKYLEQNEISLDFILFDSYLGEIISNTSNVIEFIEELSQQYKVTNILCEYSLAKSFQNQNVTGRIDLIIQTTDGDFIFDYKRSYSSIPKKNDIYSHRSIQIQTYSNLYQLGNILAIGLICNSEIDKSLIFTNNSQLLNLFPWMDRSDLEFIGTDFTTFLENLLNKINADSLFIEDSQNSYNCEYCLANFFCKKSLY